MYLSNDYNDGSRFIVELNGGVLPPPDGARVSNVDTLSIDATPSENLPHRFSILLVDDSATACKLFIRRLKALQSSIVTSVAATGEEALMLCETNAFDLIVLDQNMQPAGGLLLGHEVAREIRGRLGMNRTVIIGCTGNEATCRSDFISGGADDVWSKPTPPTADMIRAIIAARRKRIGVEAAALPCSVKVAIVDDSVTISRLLIRRLSMYVKLIKFPN